MSGAKAEGKKIRRKTKEVRKKIQAPTYLEPETGADQNRVNPYAYYKSTDLVEPVDGIQELEIRNKFAVPANAQNFRLTEIAPEKISKIGKEVKLQEMSLMGHQIASWAIDNEKPGEQKKLADIDPDLYAKMNEGPKDQAAFCMYLDQLLRKGEITNEEERLFVTSLLDPLVEIPVYPLWDPDGNVIGQAFWRAVHAQADMRQTKQKFGMFTQSLIWGADEENPAAIGKGNTDQQRALKTLILIHLLPELRHTEDGRKVTIAPARITTLVGNPKNRSVQQFIEGYLAGGVARTNMNEPDQIVDTFNKMTQTPTAYGLNLYGTAQGLNLFFGNRRANGQDPIRTGIPGV